VRFYRAGAYMGSRRLVSNTGSTGVWSTDTTIPGGGTNVFGALTLAINDTWEIGNIGWEWVTKSVEVAGRQQLAQEVMATFDAVSQSATLQKNDLIDGVEKTQIHTQTAKRLTVKMDTDKAEFDYACRVGSRTGAVLKHLHLNAVIEEDNK